LAFVSEARVTSQRLPLSQVANEPRNTFIGGDDSMTEESKLGELRPGE
jgi:hypothetical protein